MGLVLASVDWQPFAIVATFFGTVVTAIAVIVKGKQEAGISDKATEALNASSMVQTSFEGMRNQVEAWEKANLRCEHRCDELEDENRAIKIDLRVTQDELRRTQSELTRAKREIKQLKGSR